MKRFLSEQGGATIVIFAIAIVPLLLAVGLAVDFGRMHATRGKLQGAIDAAALAAASPQIQELPPGQQIARAKDVFHANCFDAICSQLKSLSIKTKDGVIIGTAAIDVPTTFMSVAGIKTTEVLVTSEVGLAGGFENVYFAIDLSSSMGVASTPAGRALLMQLSKPYMPRRYYDDGSRSEGCLYACHEREGWEPRGETLYDWAKNNNIEIREDVVVEQMAAISQKLIDGTAGGGDRVKVGVMAFSETMQVLVRPTTDLTQLSDPVSRARLRRNSTLYNVVMPQITREVGNSGDGSSEGSPRKTLILITDGVYVDDRRNFLSREFNSRECNTLKSSGVNVIVVNVKYVEDRGNYLFEDLVAPFYDRIAPELTACASSGKYYEATDTDDIVATFDILANNILAGQIRLTH